MYNGRISKILTLMAWILIAALLTACNAEPAELPLESTSVPTEKNNTQPEPTTEPNDMGIVLYDGDIATIGAGEGSRDASGYTLQLIVDNHGENNLGFGSNEIIINGITVPIEIIGEVASATTGEISLYVAEETLLVAGIEEIANIEAPAIFLYDYTTLKELGSFSFSLLLPEAIDYQQAINQGGTQIVRQDGITITAHKFISDGDGTITLVIFLKNETDNRVSANVHIQAVNEETQDVFGTSYAYPDSVAYCTINLGTQTEIKTIDLAFSVKDVDNYEPLLDQESVHLTFG